jgi:cell division protein FtsW (lipid II flippase)
MNVPLWKRTYSSQLPGKQFWRTYAVFTSCMLVFLAIYGLLYWLGHMIWPGVEPLKEVIAPALLCLPPICFLLNSRLAYPAGSTSAATEKPDFWRVAAQVAALVILLSVVYPLLLGDPGALVVTAALFLPTAIILLMGGAPWRIAALTGAFLVSGLVGVALLALQFKPALQAASALGEMKLRVMEFADSSSVEKGILFGRIARPNSFSLQPPLSATRMRQTHQHLWEMEAIARIGGYAGLGFGAAPVRKSQVRQDTLQYDSTFSFFVVSEHGLLGGVLLIGLYSLPLLIIVASARRKLDVGHALALIIASSFFLEATSHALMNLGALPETGRSMPLLAVKSISDLLRWLIFFRIAAQALMWRINSADAGYSKDPALLSDHPPQSRTPVRYSVTSVAWGAGVAIALVIVTLADSKLIHDPRLKELNWKGLLEATDSHIRQQDFVLSKGRIEPSPAIKRSGDLLFLQEMARFNELTDAEKITGLPRDEEEQFCREARDVRSVAGYNALMTQLRNADRPFHSRVAPSLFVLQRSRDDWGGDDSAEEDTEESVDAAPADPCILGPDLALKIRANGQFVSISRFEERVQAAPAVYVGSPPIPVIGTAWVDGRTIGVVNPDANIPWLSYLRTGIESGDYSPPADQSGRVTLTLDIALQQAAQEFLPRMATPWHDELLKGVKPSTRKGQTAAWEPSGIEPPRAALTILNMKNGEVLALGGFPRMAPGQAWQGGAEGEELIPPAQWVESRAPQSLQVRYGGDRNFDRLLMGSSTKPLWATAAVNVHPSLDSKLGVTGHSGSEKEIFGIPVTQKKGWEIDQVSSGLNGGWCDFRSYLAISDNRYHVRLGFLSLAEWNGDSPREGTDRKPTGDDARETIDLSTPWTKYPVFPAELMFSPDQPRRLAHVDAQPLAIQMQKIFGVQIKDANESFVRSSFWTGDEQDDNRMAPLGAAMYGASPQRVNLALDKISSPRDFVTVLLGGGANRWANVDFAGAFASAVLGSPVIPHIVRLSKAPASGRIRTVEEARKVRRGLSAAYSDSHGTVWKQFGAEAPAVQKFLEAHSGYRIYAKTGTLPAGKGVPNTSRLVLAMVKWEGDESVLKSGIVFSMVIDRGSTGLAAKWLGQFITTYQKEIAAALGD